MRCAHNHKAITRSEKSLIFFAGAKHAGTAHAMYRVYFGMGCPRSRARPCYPCKKLARGVKINLARRSVCQAAHHRPRGGSCGGGLHAMISPAFCSNTRARQRHKPTAACRARYATSICCLLRCPLAHVGYWDVVASRGRMEDGASLSFPPMQRAPDMVFVAYLARGFAMADVLLEHPGGGDPV